MLPTLIDSFIILLLIGTLVYAYILDRRVRTLMAALRELGPTVGAFSSAVDQSARSVEDLRDLSLSARRSGPDLQSAEERTPAGEGETSSEPRSALQKRAEQLRSRNPVRGQAPVRGKSDLVRTFFDISKERDK